MTEEKQEKHTCGVCGGDKLEVIAEHNEGAFVMYACRTLVPGTFRQCGASGIGVRRQKPAPVSPEEAN